MKKNNMIQSFRRTFLISGLVMIGSVVTAQINLNNVKDKGTKVISKDKEEKKETSTTTTSTDVKTTGNETGYDLYELGNAAYDAEKYSEALAYYQKAQEKGYNDGEMKIKMRECEENLDPNAQKDAEEVEKISNDTFKMMDDMKYTKTPVADNGMTNDFHTANVGKIVFSNQEILKATTSGDQLGNSFSATGDVYARVYLSRSMTNEAYSIGTFPGSNFRYRITVDGVVFPEWAVGEFLVGGDETVYNEWTTFQLALSPKVTDISEYPAIEYQNFFKKMYTLPDGAHKVKIEMVFDVPDDEIRGDGNDRLYTTKFGAERVVASGEFTFNVTQPGRVAMAKKLCPTFDYLNNHTNLVPDAFAMVDKSKREGEKVIKVVILNNDWTYVKNVYGIITSRKIAGVAIVQDVKTKLCYEVYLTFFQENISSGGDKYGSTTFDRGLGGGIDHTGISTPLFLLDCIE